MYDVKKTLTLLHLCCPCRASKSAGWQVRGVWSGGGCFFPVFQYPLYCRAKEPVWGFKRGCLAWRKRLFGKMAFV